MEAKWSARPEFKTSDSDLESVVKQDFRAGEQHFQVIKSLGQGEEDNLHGLAMAIGPSQCRSPGRCFLKWGHGGVAKSELEKSHVQSDCPDYESYVLMVRSATKS